MQYIIHRILILNLNIHYIYLFPICFSRFTQVYFNDFKFDWICSSAERRESSINNGIFILNVPYVMQNMKSHFIYAFSSFFVQNIFYSRTLNEGKRNKIFIHYFLGFIFILFFSFLYINAHKESAYVRFLYKIKMRCKYNRVCYFKYIYMYIWEIIARDKGEWL